MQAWFDQLSHDTRHALRRLRKTPSFTLTAILTLSLGIGATTAIFTLVHAVMLKSLPVSDPDRLFRVGKKTHCCVWGGYQQYEEFSIFSYSLYQYLRDHTGSLEETAAFQAGQSLFGVRREQSRNAAETYTGEFVSGNYFAMFGLPAYAGRTLTPSDDQPGAAPAAMMSYQVWQRKFALDPSVIGGLFEVDGKPFTVVGITPPAFYGDQLRTVPPNFYLPLAMEPVVQGDTSILKNVEQHWLDIIGRARPGVNANTLQAEMRVELLDWLRAHQGAMTQNERSQIPKQILFISPGGGGITSMRQDYEHWLQILMLVAGFVLLIVCANVANLMMVRGLERRQQTSLSMALGARPSRMIRQALTESVILSIFGGLAGLAVAFAGTRLILRFAFESTGAIGVGSIPISASPSLPILLFAFGISLLTGIIFGIAPAWMASQSDPVEALRGAGRSTRQSGSLPRKTLVILQAALSLVLLSAAGLLTEALGHLEHQNFGFEQERRFVVLIDPMLAGYTPQQLDVLYRRTHDAVAAIPGVQSVALSLYSPMSGDSWNESIYVEGKPAPPPNFDNGSSWARVTPDFFSTLGIRIVNGRAITEQDTASSPHVVVVNEAFAKKFFKGQDPIGKRFGKGTIQYASDYRIVGVAADARYLTYGMEKPPGEFFFAPAVQSTLYDTPGNTTGELRSHYLHDMIIAMRPGARLTETQVKQAIAGVDGRLPVLRMQTLTEQVANNFSQERLIARLTSLFGALALVLASIGLYGVTAYGVGTRTNEIGVRMALGADRRSVLALVLRGAFALIGFGLLLGLPLSLATGRFLGSQLHGLDQYDPVILGVATVTLGIAAAGAALIPAWRASSISPMEALRTN